MYGSATGIRAKTAYVMWLYKYASSIPQKCSLHLTAKAIVF